MPMSTLKRLLKRGMKPGRKFTRGNVYQKPLTSPAGEGGKRAKRGVQPEKVKAAEKRLLPTTGTPRKSTLDKMDAAEIAQKYTGRQISAMQRKFKDPKILAKLKNAKTFRKDLAQDVSADPTRGGPGIERRETMSAEFRKGGGKVTKRSGGGKIGKPQGWGSARLPPKKT